MHHEAPRIKRLEEEKTKKITENNSTYDDMINDNKKMLDEQNSWQDEYIDEQNRLLDRSTALQTDK